MGVLLRFAVVLMLILMVGAFFFGEGGWGWVSGGGSGQGPGRGYENQVRTEPGRWTLVISEKGYEFDGRPFSLDALIEELKKLKPQIVGSKDTVHVVHRSDARIMTVKDFEARVAEIGVPCSKRDE